ncbi:aminopeptidase P family protein [Hominifimenecus sp. rT4P-3]|uniref:aminopeptidase P family protein n=1 Tax=Hominifimenecus sp. rT4P-3 TaxID=3242979 RepID=UPI003DA200B7
MKKELSQLREAMKRRGLDAYLIPTADYHESEYVNEHFQFRKYISGFTGSAGTLVVTADEAGLWTDGRYFLQAEQQLSGSGITLYRLGVSGTEAIHEFLTRTIPDGGALGVDGRTIPYQMGRHLAATLEKKNISFSYEEDLAESVWTDRPPLCPKAIWSLPLSSAGIPRLEKLAQVRAELQKSGANAYLITGLDDIAWLMNLRGNDISCNPVFFSYCLLTPDKTKLFLHLDALSKELHEELVQDGICLCSYEEIYDALRSLPVNCHLFLDPSRVSYRLKQTVPKEIRQILGTNPTTLLKSKKNAAEISCLKEANRKDGAAMVKFLCWLKEAVAKDSITEITASSRLEAFRREQEGFLDLSFDTIAAYGSHAAVIHYTPTPETDTALKPEGLFLLDSGAHYIDGTTDITRTVALGPVTKEMKTCYTAVLKGMLALADAHFPSGCRGEHLDILARRPLWELGLDYRHGTGHGIGFLLNVHEGPNRFAWNTNPQKPSGILEPGMVTSDEPGFYEDGAFGIRIENDLLCIDGPDTAYGHFLAFEPLTLCPIDKEAIDISQMTEYEIELLNQYHALVWRELSGRLSEKEKAWLQQATSPIHAL